MCFLACVYVTVSGVMYAVCVGVRDHRKEGICCCTTGEHKKGRVGIWVVKEKNIFFGLIQRLCSLSRFWFSSHLFFFLPSISL